MTQMSDTIVGWMFFGVVVIALGAMACVTAIAKYALTHSQAVLFERAARDVDVEPAAATSGRRAPFPRP